MTKWLLSVVGVAFLGVLLDIIYPNGKTNAFCKSMFGIMTICIMISPLLTIKKNEYKIELFDSEVVSTINSSKSEALKIQIENNLISDGVNGVYVEIESNLSKSDFEIENIFIDTSELVLTENVTNINKYEVISQSVLEIIDIDNERIIIYG